ncbi:tyrosine-sulfated glycopeptide receptor 1-like [Hordeum vulgare]|nr:tyrosine-sulfated glycopeptide receptor 1-like [Hordeum vulgare]
MQTLHISSKTHTKKLHMPSFALALVLLISLDSLTSSCMEQERGALLQFLAGLSQNGGLAASWKNGMDCCKWEGVTYGRLSISPNSLGAPLPRQPPLHRGDR